MKQYELNQSQWIPIGIEEAWSFFSRPENLQKITPRKMNFNILTKNLPEEIYSGLLIEYKVSPVLGIPLNWITRIEDVEKPYRFTDTQLKGPYKLWHHTHLFEEKDGGTLMRDKVLYKLPLGPIGRFAHWLFVKNQLTHIFEYRRKALKDIFPVKDRIYAHT